MNWYKISAELAAAIVSSWPLAALILGTIFLVRYQGELGELMGRIRGARTPLGDLSMSDQSESNPQLDASLEVARKEAEEAQQRVNVYAVGWQYEVLYRLIFGTQIALLQFVNSQPVPRDQLRLFHTQHLGMARATNSSYNYSFDDYLDFLTNQNTITQSGQNITITEWGRGFLRYLTGFGIPLTKPF